VFSVECGAAQRENNRQMEHGHVCVVWSVGQPKGKTKCVCVCMSTTTTYATYSVYQVLEQPKGKTIGKWSACLCVFSMECGAARREKEIRKIECGAAQRENNRKMERVCV
jgi:ubiquitin C-terminal hydrolase